KPSDISLCQNQKLDFTGFTSEGAGCRSETAGKVKDAVETVLALLDIHTAAGTVASGSLGPILAMRFLGAEKEAEVKLVCGVVKVKIEGTLACEASPGLTVIAAKTGIIKIVCKTTAASDPEPPTCKILCEDVGKIGLAATFGTTPEDAWWKMTLEGSPN